MMGTNLTTLLEGPPDDVVAYAPGRVATRAELQHAATQLAAHLRDADLTGRAVAVLMRNEPDAIAAWFGVWQAGATFVPINPRVPPAERERAIAATGVSAVVTSAPLADIGRG